MPATRAAIAALLLAGCTAAPPIEHRPQVSETPYSALRIYEQGRKDALDDLRSLDVWEEPSRVCEDKVSWVSRKWEYPDWGSRKENMDLIKACRGDSLHNAILIKDQRKAVESAK
tara:strand:+ start:3671 stop:4015 length:345 start_codon:yes stop_codon:yes gene_type:complete